jgi:hypothetical protein
MSQTMKEETAQRLLRDVNRLVRIVRSDLGDFDEVRRELKAKLKKHPEIKPFLEARFGKKVMDAVTKAIADPHTFRELLLAEPEPSPREVNEARATLQVRSALRPVHELLDDFHAPIQRYRRAVGNRMGGRTRVTNLDAETIEKEIRKRTQNGMTRTEAKQEIAHREGCSPRHLERILKAAGIKPSDTPQDNDFRRPSATRLRSSDRQGRRRKKKLGN